MGVERGYGRRGWFGGFSLFGAGACNGYELFFSCTLRRWGVGLAGLLIILYSPESILFLSRHEFFASSRFGITKISSIPFAGGAIFGSGISHAMMDVSISVRVAEDTQ